MTVSNLELWDRYGDHLIPVQPFMDNVIAKSEGSWIIDVEGNRILDLAAGQFCTILGHNHPEFVKRVGAELQNNLHTGSQYVTRNVLETAQLVSEITPPGLDNLIFLSTGSEANEMALRIAKAYTNRNGVMGFDRGYYGITLGTRSLSAISQGHVDFTPEVPQNFHLISPQPNGCMFGSCEQRCELKCLQTSVQLMSKQLENIAAVIIEPVISAGGMIFPDREYLAALRAFTSEIGALLIVDEAQTGFGRCGQWFDVENLGLQPDILVFSKTSGNGYPSSGVVIPDAVKERLLDKGFFHLSSHQNDPIAAAAIAAVIGIIRENGYLEQCREMGAYFLGRLGELEAARRHVSRARGRGLMLAFEIVRDDGEAWTEMVPAFALACKERGVHVTYSYYEGVIRIIPSISLAREEIDFAIGVFDEVLHEMQAGRLDAAAHQPANKVYRSVFHRNRLRKSLFRLWETSPQYWVRKLRGKDPAAGR